MVYWIATALMILAGGYLTVGLLVAVRLVRLIRIQGEEFGGEV